MSRELSSKFLQGGFIGEYYGLIKGETGSLDYSSCVSSLLLLILEHDSSFNALWLALACQDYLGGHVLCENLGLICGDDLWVLNPQPEPKSCQ